MKKIIIFLIPLIVSIPAFAKDKSSITENFSLINHSGARYRELFEIDIFSERTILSRIATFENRNQKWGTVDNLIYGQQGNINSAKESESLAESYLRRLAKSHKKTRKTWGYVELIGGGICLALGASALSAAEEADVWGRFWLTLGGAALVTGGIVGVGGGILSLAIKSSAERKYDGVLRIPNSVERERASHEALSSLAARGRLRRMITGAVFSALAVYSMFKDEEDSSSAAAFGGLAIYSFLRKSRAERTYQNYLKEKEHGKEMALRLGIMPHGGVKIGLGLTF